ncbi:MAG: hypothetical protein IJW77_11740, partial [Clostridia bacterium]|nr:hypothetical protein [Clostridia bacterium]
MKDIQRCILPAILSVLLCLLISCTDAEPTGADTVRVNEETAIHYKICHSGGGRIEGWTSQHGIPGEMTKQTVTAKPKYGYVFTGW